MAEQGTPQIISPSDHSGQPAGDTPPQDPQPEITASAAAVASESSYDPAADFNFGFPTIPEPADEAALLEPIAPPAEPVESKPVPLAPITSGSVAIAEKPVATIIPPTEIAPDETEIKIHRTADEPAEQPTKPSLLEEAGVLRVRDAQVAQTAAINADGDTGKLAEHTVNLNPNAQQRAAQIHNADETISGPR